MRQHQESPTTEDIAALDETGATTDPVDSERTDADRVESERVDRAEPERDAPTGHVDQDRSEWEAAPTSGRATSHRPGADRAVSDDAATDEAVTDRETASGQLDSDRLDSNRLDSNRVVAVDETARPADTTLAGQTRPGGTGSGADETTSGHAAADVLFDPADAQRFRDRWREVQTGFVDDPKRAVQDADVLVAELMQNLASAFGERKRLLEDQWREGTDAETEDLRLALRGYRSFVDQLLAH